MFKKIYIRAPNSQKNVVGVGHEYFKNITLGDSENLCYCPQLFSFLSFQISTTDFLVI